MALKINAAGSSASVGEGPDGMVLLGSDVRVYRTPSSSRQGVMHFTIVDLLTDMYPQCSCEGYTYRGKCKHADYAHKVWLDEIEASRQLGPPVGNDKDTDAGPFTNLPKE